MILKYFKNLIFLTFPLKQCRQVREESEKDESNKNKIRKHHCKTNNFKSCKIEKTLIWKQIKKRTNKLNVDPSYAWFFLIQVWTELKTLEWWISRSMLDLLFISICRSNMLVLLSLLISSLINWSGLRISHSKVLAQITRRKL